MKRKQDLHAIVEVARLTASHKQDLLTRLWHAFQPMDRLKKVYGSNTYHWLKFAATINHPSFSLAREFGPMAPCFSFVGRFALDQ